SLPVTEGLGQAKRDAKRLQTRFAYATNGEGIYRVDMQTGKEGPVSSWPIRRSMRFRRFPRMRWCVSIRRSTARKAGCRKTAVCFYHFNDGYLTPFRVRQIATTLD